MAHSMAVDNVIIGDMRPSLCRRSPNESLWYPPVSPESSSLTEAENYIMAQTFFVLVHTASVMARQSVHPPRVLLFPSKYKQ